VFGLVCHFRLRGNVVLHVSFRQNILCKWVSSNNVCDLCLGGRTCVNGEVGGIYQETDGTFDCVTVDDCFEGFLGCAGWDDGGGSGCLGAGSTSYVVIGQGWRVWGLLSIFDKGHASCSTRVGTEVSMDIDTRREE
jgi:hypothetical protein